MQHYSVYRAHLSHLRNVLVHFLLVLSGIDSFPRYIVGGNGFAVPLQAMCRFFVVRLPIEVVVDVDDFSILNCNC